MSDRCTQCNRPKATPSDWMALRSEMEAKYPTGYWVIDANPLADYPAEMCFGVGDCAFYAVDWRALALAREDCILHAKDHIDALRTEACPVDWQGGIDRIEAALDGEG